MPQMAVEVKAVTVEPSSTITYADKVGEVRGSQEVDLRARVSGILLKTHFEDGALVQEGQLLFSIDAARVSRAGRQCRAPRSPRPRRTSTAPGRTWRVTSRCSRTRPSPGRSMTMPLPPRARRRRRWMPAGPPCRSRNWVSTTPRCARLCSGRIGAAQVFPGGLVTAGQTLLATISSDDPAWVYFTISESELLEFERRNQSRVLAADDPMRVVQLILSDGSVYPLPGRINFSDRALDATTGTLEAACRIPEPGP